MSDRADQAQYQRSIIQSVLKYSIGIQLKIQTLGRHVDMLTSNLPYLNDSVLLGESEALAYAACHGIGQVQQK